MTGSKYDNIITRERRGIWTDNNMPPWWALAYIIKL
jgi:hypothetical protein